MAMDMWPVFEKVAPFSRRMVLYGPPGTGKTRTAQLLAQRHAMQCLSVTITEEMSAAGLVGHWVPNETGGVVWVGVAQRPVRRRVAGKEADHATAQRDQSRWRGSADAAALHLRRSRVGGADADQWRDDHARRGSADHRHDERRQHRRPRT